jgi:hypothetical protein
MEGTALAALIALVIPLVVAFVAKAHTSSAIKGAAALVASVIVGAVTVFLGGNAALEQYATTILAVVVVAQSSYAMFWKPSGVTSWILDNLGNT